MWDSTPEQWERAQLMEALTQDPARSWDVDSAVDTQTRILGDWKADRARHATSAATRPEVFDDRYYRRWAAMEATDTQLDLAEERAAAALAQTPPGADRSPAAFRAALLNELGQIVTKDARTAFHSGREHNERAAARRIAQAPTGLAAADRLEHAQDDVTALHMQQLHDSHEVRVARAEQLAEAH